ncbi:class I SAM-dependent methyltransferase [Streptomyces venezuelae]|uniref:class I SAM-dependent methyltransferase n=1 Tax=Streptomyces venezuelae TaxID=54571 RepID=UPI003432FB6C
MSAPQGSHGSPDPAAHSWPAAQDWDEWHRAGRACVAPFREREWFIQNFAPSPQLAAADLGCGTGQWTRQLTRWGMQATGYDFSREALRQARAAGAHPRLCFAFWDVNSTRPPDTLQPRSVDLVTCRWSLAYFNLTRLLATVTWILKPHGTLYILTPLHAPGRDPLDRGLTQAQIAQLMTGWQSSRTRDFHRTVRGLVLRGYASTAERTP